MESIAEKIKRNFESGTLINRASKAAINRFNKWIRHANFLYFLDKERLITKRYQQKIPKINANHYPAGNYFLDKRIALGKESVVYSLGILTDISFDLFMANQFGCKVYMYDPTPVTVDFMKKYEANKHLLFRPIAVWTENGTIKFYESKFGGSASAVFQISDQFFEARCATMETLIKENNHTGIDVFKADIEGAALPILEQMIDNDIIPGQIVVEFERPQKNIEEVNSFFQRLTNIRNKLKAKEYEEYLLPRGSAKYYSIELLFVDTKKYKNENSIT